MNPVLTLAIPSRKIPDSLFSSLIKIRNEVESLGLIGFVEVLVSLNPSVPIDTIPHQLEDLMKNYGRVVMAPGNLSYDRHINFLVTQSRGRWVKFLADDDELMEGALIILKEILTSNPNLACLVHDFDYWRHDDSKIQLIGLRKLRRGQMPGPWGQILNTLFARDFWLEAPRPEDSNYVHGFKFEYIASMNLDEAWHLPQKLVKVRPGAPNFSETPYLKVLVTIQSLGVIKELKTQGADAFVHRRRVRSDMVYFLRTLAFSRANKAQGLLYLSVRAIRLWPRYALAWAALPISVTPRWVLNALRRITSPKSLAGK